MTTARLTKLNQPDRKGSGGWLLLFLAVLVGLGAAGIWMQTARPAHDHAEDPDRQARIERMAQYLAIVDDYRSGGESMSDADQIAADRMVRPTVQLMCELASHMTKDDISSRAQFMMQLHQCWDPLTREITQ